MENSTLSFPGIDKSYLSTTHPWYYNTNSQSWSVMSDFWFAILGPVAAYWLLAVSFDILDRGDWDWLQKYKIHESWEVTSRNTVTKKKVIFAVIVQQIIQTLLGYIWMDATVENGGPVSSHVPRMEAIAPTVLRFLETVLGRRVAAFIWLHEAQELVYFVYWWAVPLVQLLLGLFVIDTWQYFLHRAVHTYPILFKTFHSWHHRLYVPYAYGALYNHPIEGFALDTFGTALAERLTGMSVRQATLLFMIATFKTIDDHCGYSFPFDPLQWFTANNSDYHDIHHQAIGIKSNFSQPFFVHWDVLLGTRMTRQDIEARRKHKSAETKSS